MCKRSAVSSGTVGTSKFARMEVLTVRKSFHDPVVFDCRFYPHWSDGKTNISELTQRMVGNAVSAYLRTVTFARFMTCSACITIY